MTVELMFFFKIFLAISVIILFYAIIKNLDIIKIILIYFKDKLLRK